MFRCTLFLRIRTLRRRRSSICCGRAIRPICLAIARRSATRGAARRFCDRYSPAIFLTGIDRASMRWRPILSTFGVVDVARAGDEPAAVLSNIVAAIQERESAGDSTASNRRHSLHPGELVRVTAGAFEEMIGTLIELRDRDRVVVLLEWLGRTVRAQLRAEAVEAA
jgi:hypothetical protein